MRLTGIEDACILVVNEREQTMNDQAVTAEVLLDCGQEVIINFSASGDEPLDEAAMREATERGLRPASVISIDFCEHNEGAER